MKTTVQRIVVSPCPVPSCQVVQADRWGNQLYSRGVSLRLHIDPLPIPLPVISYAQQVYIYCTVHLNNETAQDFTRLARTIFNFVEKSLYGYTVHKKNRQNRLCQNGQNCFWLKIIIKKGNFGNGVLKSVHILSL